MQDRTFEGRVAFITGATRGIGKEIALQLAKRGCKIVVTGKTEEPNPKLPGTLAQTVKEIAWVGGDALAVRLDVRDDAAIKAAVDAALDRFGRIDFLVNNAGALHWQPLERTPMKRFDLVMGINARASFACAYHVLPAMRRQNYGHILMLSPPVDIGGAPGKIAYAISKFGMTLIAQGLAHELAGTNVAANALWPATMIDTAAVRNTVGVDPKLCRTPAIVADAAMRIFEKEPRSFTGHALIDDVFLVSEGVTDLSVYRCDPDHEPPQLPFSFKVEVGKY